MIVRRMFGASGAEVMLSGDELAMINSALNDICNAVDMDDGEFQTRLDFERSELDALLDEVHRVVEATRVADHPTSLT